MRRTSLLAVAGLAALVTGCSGAASTAGSFVPIHHPRAARTVEQVAAPAAVAKTPAAALRLAVANTLGAQTAAVSEEISFPDIPAKAGRLNNMALQIAGNVDFAHDRGRVLYYPQPQIDKFTADLQPVEVVQTRGKDYLFVAHTQIGFQPEPKGGSVKLFLQDERFAAGPITDDGMRDLSQVGLTHEYSFRIKLTELLASDSPSNLQDAATRALAQSPATEDVYVDSTGRIVCLVETITIAGTSLPANERRVRAVIRLSGFGGSVYQHVNPKGQPTSLFLV
ncbi:MAG TPA: hypothetical protein VNG13_01705 [Mycobacteriales bacterium]|nr:hypothetical protein [Mycobacteriales bacterium]